MKIWSKTLTNLNLVECCEQVNADYPGCKIALNSTYHVHVGPRSRYFEKVRIESVRGSDEWRTHASWTEWGWWLARIFEIDPDARANEYRGRADFHSQTEGRFLHMPSPRKRQIRMEEARAYAHAQTQKWARDPAAREATQVYGARKASTHSTPKTRIT